MSAEAYRRLTYAMTLAVARQLLPGNPGMVFEYILVRTRRQYARRYEDQCLRQQGSAISGPIGEARTCLIRNGGKSNRRSSGL